MSGYGEYDGAPVHDMWVDYTYHEYTGGLTDWYRSDPNRGCGYRSHAQIAKSTSDSIGECRRRIALYESNIKGINADIERINKLHENTHPAAAKNMSHQHTVDKLTKRIMVINGKIDRENAKLIPLLIKREKERNLWIIIACIAGILASLIIFQLIYR